MDATDKVKITTSTRLPLHTYEQVALFAKRRGLLKASSGAPNTSAALVALVEAGLEAERKRQEVVRT